MLLSSLYCIFKVNSSILLNLQLRLYFPILIEIKIAICYLPKSSPPDSCKIISWGGKTGLSDNESSEKAIVSSFLSSLFFGHRAYVLIGKRQRENGKLLPWEGWPHCDPFLPYILGMHTQMCSMFFRSLGPGLDLWSWPCGIQSP